MAQDDDMYFVPTKENVAKEAKEYGMPQQTYYAGSPRSVDDYNRRAWSSVEPIDSAGNDIIDFSAVRGVYPDSVYDDAQDSDYQLTRRMSRFDDYTPSTAYWDGYRAGRWSSPWYSSWYSWYDPWYWNDPWYYSSWYGWHDPWYYGGWYSPWYHGWYGGIGWYGGWYGGRRYYAGGRQTWSRTGGTRHISGSAGRNNNLGGYRSRSYQGNGSSTNRSFGNNSNLGGTRSYSSGGSFGGSRSFGSSGGGRSVGGGRSYGGRR